MFQKKDLNKQSCFAGVMPERIMDKWHLGVFGAVKVVFIYLEQDSP